MTDAGLADHGTADLQAAEILPRCPEVPGITVACTCGRLYTSAWMYGRMSWYRAEDSQLRGERSA